MIIYSSKKCRLISMIALSVFFFFVEVIGGCITNSTALTADSFHMLTDIVAMLVSFMSARMTTKKWKRNTFGWARADVMGALVNAVFLFAVCVTTIIKACKHFSEGSKIQEPFSLVVVGILGLFVNIIGLCLFYSKICVMGVSETRVNSEHGFAHGHGHGHSHTQKFQKKKNDDITNYHATTSSPVQSVSGLVEQTSEAHTIDFEKGKTKRTRSSRSKRKHLDGTVDLNMRGAFLHVFSDALGSVIVIISALVVWKTTWAFRFYLDPGLSIVWVCLILRSAWPLLRESSLILLQSVPRHINIEDLRKRLLNLDGVLDVHEFHVWQLTGSRIIATAHIRCSNLAEYMITAERVKEFFHNEGIHSTTIQPEFFQLEELLDNTAEITVVDAEFCALSCPIRTEEDDCSKNTCCQIKHKKLKSRSRETTE